MEMHFKAKYRVWHGGKDDGKTEHEYTQVCESLAKFSTLLETHVAKTGDIIRYVTIENQGNL